jgi:hypothetical protein
VKPTTTQSTETKTDGAQSGKSLINEKGSPEGAPEQYEDFKVPDGFTLDKDIAGEVGALFKEGNLSQAYAQKLVDFYVAKTTESHNQPYEQYQDTRQTWRNEINADPDIGGAKLNGVMVSISKLIDSFGDAKVADAFREAMDYTGAGDNPGVVKGLYALAKRLTEGGPVRGSNPSLDGMRRPGEGRPSAAQAIYPNLKSSFEQG